jgi:hypothetical protein
VFLICGAAGSGDPAVFGWSARPTASESKHGGNLPTFLNLADQSGSSQAHFFDEMAEPVFRLELLLSRVGQL